MVKWRKQFLNLFRRFDIRILLKKECEIVVNRRIIV